MTFKSQKIHLSLRFLQFKNMLFSCMLRNLKCLLTKVSFHVCLTETGRRHHSVCLQLRTGTHGVDHYAVLGVHVLQRCPEPHQSSLSGDRGGRAAEQHCEHLIGTRYEIRVNKEMMIDNAVHCKMFSVNFGRKMSTTGGRLMSQFPNLLSRVSFLSGDD